MKQRVRRKTRTRDRRAALLRKLDRAFIEATDAWVGSFIEAVFGTRKTLNLSKGLET